MGDTTATKGLKEIRKERKMGVRRLARLAPASPRTIINAEKGESTPTVETIRKISRVLNVDPMEVTEFRAALEAEGLDALPEELKPETPFADVFREEDEEEEYETEPGGGFTRDRMFVMLVHLMRDLGKMDTDRAYRRAFEVEPPQN